MRAWRLFLALLLLLVARPAFAEDEQVAHQDASALALMRMRAYLDAGNELWAMRTAAEHLSQHPEDREVQAHLAWLYLSQGSLEEARELLHPKEAWRTSALFTRRELLLSFLARHAGDEDAARAHLDAAYGARAAYEEDRAAIAELLARDPSFLAPFSGRFELGLGYAANALASSPAELGAAAGSASALGQLSGWLRLVPARTGVLRPSVELSTRGLGYATGLGQDASYLLLGARPGLVLGGLPQLLVAYRYEGLGLAGGDRYDEGPLWFYDTHRGELELSLHPSLTIFGGAGRRLFRELGKSRTEADLGLGGGLLLGRSWRLMGALTGRWYDAVNSAYDTRGGSMLVNAELALPAGLAARIGASFAMDDYPRSAGFFDAASPDVARRDLLARLSLGVLGPAFGDGLRAGLSYEYARRESTTDLYDYDDHRVLAKLQWSFALDPWLPRAVHATAHVPIDYGLDSTVMGERVQDLLRQDEAAQRSSSCVQ